MPPGDAATRSNGFSLTEFFVEEVVIELLAMIAMRQFMEYSVKGFDAFAPAELRNVATWERMANRLASHS
jgi:Tfp pilus assembly protein PilE